MDIGSQLIGLSNLLGGAVEEDHGDDDIDTNPMASMTPGSIGPATKQKRIAGKKKKPAAELKASAKDIWDVEEVNVEDHGAEDDPRPQPEYDILYKQAVSSEDMYLGMSGRDASSHWCEDMIVKIKLPGHKMADCELDVTDKFLDLRTTTHRLGLHLPYPCDSKNGSAKFVNEKQELQVTLRMMREMDWTRDGPPQ